MTKEQTILITPQGYLALETELNDLKLKKRPEVIAALQEARSLGDLSENAEYDAARNEQAQVEARIKELEFKLEHCQVMDGASKETVSVGSNVTLNYIDDDRVFFFLIIHFSGPSGTANPRLSRHLGDKGIGPISEIQSNQLFSQIVGRLVCVEFSDTGSP